MRYDYSFSDQQNVSHPELEEIKNISQIKPEEEP